MFRIFTRLCLAIVGKRFYNSNGVYFVDKEAPDYSRYRNNWKPLPKDTIWGDITQISCESGRLEIRKSD